MFSKRLRNLRENRRMKQEDLGKMVGLSASTIGMYEQQRRQPDNDMLLKLSEIFDVSIDYLLGKTEIKNYNNPFDDNIEKQIFIKLKNMDKKQKKIILDIINIIYPNDEV